MLLSLCMIVRNERSVLERCLRSVAGVADDIVVVDTGSTDGTREIAEKAGARVFDFPWVDDFSAPRNRALAEARAPWILVLDADEQLLEPDRLALRDLLRRHTPAEGAPGEAFNLIVNNSSDGGRTGMRARILRLFPNHPQIRYEWPIHEQVATSVIRLGLPTIDADISILHDGYADKTRNVAKQRRNLAILQRQLASGEAYPLTYFLTAGAHLDLGEYENALRAYEECARRGAAADPFARGSRVRVAWCLEKLGRHAEACETAKILFAAGDEHPELWLALGRSLAALGDARGAKDACAKVLEVADGVFVPPCDLTTIKIEAVLGLATQLKAEGDEPRATRLLREAVSRRQAGQPLDRPWLATALG